MRGRRRQPVEMNKLWDADLSKLQFQKNRKRAAVVCTVFFFIFGVIVIRLVTLMVLDHDMLSKRASQQYVREQTLQPQRGIIWDRAMKEMASNIEADSLYAVPSRISDTIAVSRGLAPIINVSYKQLNSTLLEKKDRDFIWISRKMDLAGALKVSELKKTLNCDALGFLPETKRFYPKGQTAAHIIGFANIDNKGLAGIELMYEKYLTGAVRSVTVGRDARGNRLTGEVRSAIAGNNLILTLDEGIQHIVEREMTAAIHEWNAKAASAVMMDPVTGEILAMANRPTFDPNSPGKFPDYARRNRAITDLYEPGSTLKAVLGSAAIEKGAVRTGELFDASDGYIEVGGKRIRDVHRHGILTFQEVIQRSSNVGAVKIGLKLGAERYYAYLKAFGFGERTGIDFPGEVRGLLRNTGEWSGVSLAALSIGQEIGATPLQVLRAYSAIANGGLLMIPYVVSDVISPSGEEIKRTRPRIERRVISEKTAAIIKDILKTVVEEGGTAQRASINGNPVAGKTGTAQIFDPKTGRYSKNRYVSSFVGFVPADAPKLALIVVIYEPKKAAYGGVVAAPVFKNIVEHTLAYLDVPMEREENRLLLVSQ